MSNLNKKYTFIDLFSGCGGLTEGFLQTGKYEALAHVEWEEPMVITLRNRLVKKWGHSDKEAKMKVVHFDIQRTSELINGKWADQSITEFASTNDSSTVKNGLRGIIGRKKVDLIIGGPPCQAYSIAGRAQDKNSMKDDYRNFLFESFVKVVQEFQPKIFVFENVPGMLSAAPGDIQVTERVYSAFKEIGYTINFPDKLKNNVYSANDFGVAQNRNRLIIIGVNNNDSLDLNEIYNCVNKQKTNEKPVVKDVLKNLPSFMPLPEVRRENGKNISHVSISDKSVKNHSPRFHNKRDIHIFQKWVKNKMNQRSNQEKIKFYNDLMNRNSNHAKYRNLEWEKPSPTVVAHLYKDGLMFIHPDANQARSITVREAALLQSFPNDFEFLGSQGFCYKMIGNAVPPLMAKSIGLGICNYLNKAKK